MLFLGLLTLLNAPFDWFSLGLTRGLLRRGLELGGWWPALLAVIDALAAVAVVALLAIVCALGIQAFDDLAIHGGAKARVLPLGDLLLGMRARPGDPEYWWVYAMLLSTLIPSIVNLVLAGFCFLRGLPGASSSLLRFMPAEEAPADFDRIWIALLLTGQIMLGVLLGIAAQIGLVWLFLGTFLPVLGFGLLDIVGAVVELELPSRFGRWLGAMVWAPR